MPAPSSADLVLHGDAFWISPYFFSAYVALREKGLPFEVAELALHKDENHRPEYRDRSLTGRVPALRHGDFWLAESNAIAEYLEEAFPPPQYPRLFPEGLRERARARQLMAWIRSDLMPVREERGAATMFYERTGKPLSAQGREAAENLLRVAGLVVPEGRTTLFNAWCLADADLAFMLHRLILNGDEVPARLRTYAEAQWQRPSVRAFVEHVRVPYQPY